VADVEWLVTYDANWAAGLQSGYGWNEEFTRTDADRLRSNRSYHVTVEGLDEGSAMITSTAIISRSTGYAKRVIKVHLAQAYQQPPALDIYALMAGGWDNGNGQFEGGNITIATKGTIKGGLLANNDLIVQQRGKKDVKIDTTPVIWKNDKWLMGKAEDPPTNITNLAAGTIDTSKGPLWVDNQEVTTSYSGTATQFTMPSLDFDLLRSEANVYLTGSQLSFLLKSSSRTYTGVVFVNGDVRIPSSRSLTINGLLVVGGNVEMTGEDGVLDVNTNPLSGKWHNAGGIICRGNVSLAGNFTVDGLIYSLGIVELKGEKPGADRTIHGAVLGRQIDYKGKEELAITLDGNSRDWIDVVLNQAGDQSGEPTTLRVDAWTEVY
jgi:hypothetical protein